MQGFVQAHPQNQNYRLIAQEFPHPRHWPGLQPIYQQPTAEQIVHLHWHPVAVEHYRRPLKPAQRHSQRPETVPTPRRTPHHRPLLAGHWQHFHPAPGIEPTGPPHPDQLRRPALPLLYPLQPVSHHPARRRPPCPGTMPLQDYPQRHWHRHLQDGLHLTAHRPHCRHWPMRRGWNFQRAQTPAAGWSIALLPRQRRSPALLAGCCPGPAHPAIPTKTLLQSQLALGGHPHWQSYRQRPGKRLLPRPDRTQSPPAAHLPVTAPVRRQMCQSIAASPVRHIPQRHWGPGSTGKFRFGKFR